MKSSGKYVFLFDLPPGKCCTCVMPGSPDYFDVTCLTNGLLGLQHGRMQNLE